LMEDIALYGPAVHQALGPRSDSPHGHGS
jgi:hypothetical protein